MIERVVVISDDAVESGGAAGVALRSVRMLCARGVPVTLLNGSIDSGLDLPGLEMRSLGGRALLEGGRGAAALRGLYSRSARRFVEEWIARNDTPGTVYHLHNWHKVLSPAVFTALGRVADRLVMTAHDYFLVCPNGGQFDFRNGGVCERVPLSMGCVATNCDRRHYAHKLWRVGRQAIRSAAIDLARGPATVVAVHEGMRPYLARGGIGADGVAVLRNPVLPWRSERVRAEGNREILFVGRLERDKGVDVVAAAAREAGLPLRIVGDGPLRAELARDYPEASLMGWRSPAEIAGLAEEARLLVVPTRWRETFGLVTLEAVMSGLPVLVSRHALIAQEVVDLGCGEACDPDDRASLAAQMRRLAGDDLQVRWMSESGFYRARDLAPQPEAWCDSLLALYRAKLAAARTARPPAGQSAASEALAAAMSGKS
ncbi:glycosyltransferase family 4 protein [Methylobacterium dankookense]|uniref:D-inositol-3-phosphate glycosyltransferase n=1 Tax=Methylobacterium dankookense TaxID=560405 RepID=A0A564FX53_9HYPH|nr:glycosyltransferase family 4 protein [Methylobacterium dankookense]GJD54714.1 D-inositol-3-phosphate glycosyltransferase [Methylobacterium dankookense]VUF12582.1 Glycogen synthase [Methylobacterium dankookense]